MWGTPDDFPEIPEGMPEEIAEALKDMIQGVQAMNKTLNDIDKPAADEVREAVLTAIADVCSSKNTKERRINRATQNAAILDACATYLIAQLTEDLTVHTEEKHPGRFDLKTKESILNQMFGLWQMMFSAMLANHMGTAEELIQKDAATREVESIFAGFGSAVEKTD